MSISVRRHLGISTQNPLTLRDDEQTSADDEADSKVEGNREPVGERRRGVLGALGDDGSDDLTDGEEELPSRDDRSTNVGGRNLGEIERRAVGDDSDTHAEDQTSHDEERFGTGDNELKTGRHIHTSWVRAVKLDRK